MKGEERMPGFAATSGGRKAGDNSLLVHVHISKTAGSTLNHILRSSYGPRHCPVEPWDSGWGPDPFTLEDLRRLRRLYPNLRSIAGHRIFGYVDLSDRDIDATYFALVRDPVKACASRFQHKVDRTGNHEIDGFESWLENDWSRNRHTRAIAGTDSADDAIRLIREKNIFMGITERFDASVLLLKKSMAPDLDVSYERVNVARHRSVAERLLSDERTRRLIEDAQAEDQRLYEYVKEELWGEYVDAYGPDFDEDLERFQADSGRFNRRNIFMSRLKAYTVYKPALALHRMRSGSG